MTTLKLSEIRIDGGTQPRQKIDYETVKNYSELMRDGVVFPPIVTYFDGVDYWLADGFHRFHGYKSNAVTTVEAEVHTGSVEDAQEYSFGANKGRGKDMSAEDNREIIRKMLLNPRWNVWSQKKIADWVGVSIMTVSRVKASMDPKDQTTTTKYTKNGKELEMNTSNVGKRAKKEKDPEPKKEDLSEEKISELADTVNQLSEENEKLKDAIALGQWDASDIEKIDAEETIAELRERIKILEIDNKSLRESRDMFQTKNAELMKTVASLQRKLKKDQV